MAEAAPPESGDVGPFRVVSAPTQAGPSAPSTLPREPRWVVYDPELERVCRIAASVGGDAQAAPLSYTALVIAFLLGEDPTSKWFQKYVADRPTSIDVHEIYRSKGTDANGSTTHLSRAASGVLPRANPLYSRSVRNVMDQAARIARDVARTSASFPALGTRHVMAAYAFRNPSDHQDQVRGWGFAAEDWQREFLAFAEQRYPQEEWSRLEGYAPSYGETVSSFTSDDPLAPVRDLIGIEQEAAAFARITAAKSIKPPLAIGVFGEWGSGKTFFMRRIYEEVDRLSEGAAKRRDGSLFHADIVQIRFNAWHYIETNLWASLVDYIFAELDRWLLQKTGDGHADSDAVFNRLATAQQLKLDALEGVVTRRAERRSAELRAERARREYEEAVANASALGTSTYARALLETLLSQPDVQQHLAGIGKALGTPAITDSAGQVMDVLEQARSEAGRTRLIVRSGVSALGTWPWLLSVVLALVGLPVLMVWAKNLVAWLTNSDAIKTIHDSVLALAGIAAAVAACASRLVGRASKILDQVDTFDKTLRDKVTKQIEKRTGHGVVAQKVAAEDVLKKRRQALEAAERALADADARLATARREFESTSARSRLNAFIRAKATDGDYAKHLGIIAAIRRDFGQLTTLMDAVDNADQQRAETARLAAETRNRVQRFLDWLRREPDVRLTPGELRSLLSLLEPAAALKTLASKRSVLLQHFEGTEDDFNVVRVELEAIEKQPIPRFSRIILYIDDLDRCPADTVVKVLQAVHLLLSFPLFSVVVAVDARWVSRALKEEFPKLLTEKGMFASNGDGQGGAGATSHDYLEKIFQIPYWVRPIDPESAANYVNNLVEPDVRRVARVPGDLAPGTPPDASDPGTPPPPNPPTPPRGDGLAAPPEVAGLELTRWEADALERFAPLVGATPRRLTRFVNVYRLVRTSLPAAALERLVGERGESNDYRALIAQLAIVTGAPESAERYFSVLEASEPEAPLESLLSALANDRAFRAETDWNTVERILRVASESPGAPLTAGHMLVTAPVARRYSFTARPH